MDEERMKENFSPFDSATQEDRSLEERISILEQNALSRYLDVESKDIIEQTISERILDIVWNDYFYYSTWFESPDGFTIVNNVTISGGGCDVRSPASGSASSTISVTNTSFAGGFSFEKESRMRTTAQFLDDDNQDVRVAIGDVTGGHAYGFRVSGNTLQGFAQTAAGTRTTIDVVSTISKATDYDLEAYFYPGTKVEFFVDGESKGGVSATLPTTTATKLWESQATESEAVEKAIFMGSLEYIQRKN